tara:strand:+ start:408 stop:626 length:219 start_codon:yes stop_codon:yes gene_type:complete
MWYAAISDNLIKWLYYSGSLVAEMEYLNTRPVQALCPKRFNNTVLLGVLGKLPVNSARYADLDCLRQTQLLC